MPPDVSGPPPLGQRLQSCEALESMAGLEGGCFSTFKSKLSFVIFGDFLSGSIFMLMCSKVLAAVNFL